MSGGLGLTMSQIEFGKKRAHKADLSAPFSVDAVGTDGQLELRCEDGTIAELAVKIGGSNDNFWGTRATTVTVRDRFIIKNDTGVDFDFSEYMPLHEAEAPVRLLPADGRDVPLRWHSTTLGEKSAQLQRKLRIRPHGGSHTWSAFFSAEAVGKVVLKLRPSEAKGAQGRRGAPAAPPGASKVGETLYLVLTVSMRGAQRLLSILLLEDHKRHLPYKVVNRSDLLIAFRQEGCPHWDLLGAAEACDYIWDDPSGSHQLQVHACDAAGRFSATSDPYKVAREQSKHPELRLADRADDHGLAPSVSRAVSETPVLFSVACKLVIAEAPAERGGAHDAEAVDGWLCLTSTHLVFIVFVPPTSRGTPRTAAGCARSRPPPPPPARPTWAREPGVDADDARDEHARDRAAPMTTTARPAAELGGGDDATAELAGAPFHQLHTSPLRLQELSAVRLGSQAPGEVAVSLHAGSRVVVRALNNADSVVQRIRSHMKLSGSAARLSVAARSAVSRRMSLAQSTDKGKGKGGDGGGGEGEAAARRPPPARRPRRSRPSIPSRASRAPSLRGARWIGCAPPRRSRRATRRSRRSSRAPRTRRRSPAPRRSRARRS